MAPPKPKQLKVRLPENEAVAAKLLEKRQSMMEQPGGLSENQKLTLATAHRKVCAAKEPIRTLGDLARTKGVGDWVIGLMKGSLLDSVPALSPPKGGDVINCTNSDVNDKRFLLFDLKEYSLFYWEEKKTNETLCAIEELCSLHNIDHTLQEETMTIDLPPTEMIRGKSFMLKQELIDAAEASGLSQHAIGPNNSRAKPGSSQNDWYTGWSCMKTLLSNALVVKWSNPAKYKLTEEGKETAHDCLARSGLDDPAGPSMRTNHSGKIVLSDSDSDEPYQGNDPLIGSEKFTERSGLPNSKASSSSSHDSSKGPTTNFGVPASSVSPLSSRGVSGLQSFNTMGSAEYMDNSILAMPPRRLNENFLKAYDVVLILDNRDTFGPHSRRKVVDNIRSQFHIPVEMKRLPVGDGIWIARHRGLDTEYVLDFIIERKNVSDLGTSIRDNRYRDQKLRLKKCGLRKLIYLVEGDPNNVESLESIKSACFTTEILDGFDVHRTTGYSDTERTYGYLTLSIIDYYSRNFSVGADTSRLCLTYDEFEKRCSDLEKVTVSDIFALQLMQVPQVTEETALAVIDLYPTLFSLAQAYSMLDGDRRAQKEMLKNKSKMVNAGASKNIFKLVWAEG